MFDHGNYDTQKLLRMGFILCHHIDTQRAADCVWGLVNHEIKDTISRD